jgi:hypothetical protein
MTRIDVKHCVVVVIVLVGDETGQGLIQGQAVLWGMGLRLLWE